METNLNNKPSGTLEKIGNFILTNLTPDFLKNIRAESILESKEIDEGCKKRIQECAAKGVISPIDRQKIIGFDKGMKLMGQMKISDTSKVLGADFFAGVIAGQLGLPMSNYDNMVILTIGDAKTPYGYQRREAYNYGRSVGANFKRKGQKIDSKLCLQIFSASNFSKFEDTPVFNPPMLNDISTSLKGGNANKPMESSAKGIPSGPKRETRADGSVVVTDIFGRKSVYASQWLANSSTDFFTGAPLTMAQIQQSSNRILEESKRPSVETQRLQKNLEKHREFEKIRDGYVDKYKEAVKNNNKFDMQWFADKARQAEWQSNHAIGANFGLDRRAKGIDYK